MHPVLRLALLAVLAPGAVLAQPFQIERLGIPPGTSSSGARAISSDGRTVVGETGTEGFRWTAETGVQSLGSLPASASSVSVAGASSDATAVCGTLFTDTQVLPAIWAGSWQVHSTGLSGGCTLLSADGTTIAGTESPDPLQVFPFRGAAGGGRTRLQRPTGFSGNGITLVGISANGSVIAGTGRQLVSGLFRERPMRWDGVTPTVLPFPGDGTGQARAVSADGSTVVGFTLAGGAGARPQAARWSAGGREDLGPDSEQATHVSSDGSVVVGTVRNAAGFDDLFWWTAATGAVRPALPTGWRGILVGGLSADGQVVVGNREGVRNLFLWTPAGGFVDLVGPVSGFRVDGISADGSVLFGSTTNEAFILRLRAPGLVVRDAGDAPDAAPGDGACATADGACTLRAALLEAGATPTGQAAPGITFALPPGAEIAPQTPLPDLARAMTLDGTAQPGGPPVVNGGLLAGAASGLRVTAAGVTVRGLAVVNAPGFGIDVDGAPGVRLAGNRLGVRPDGTPLPNDAGALRLTGAADAAVGDRGAAPADRNTLFGPLVVGAGARARIYLNTLEVAIADAQALDLRAPLDVDDDGPTCGAWTRTATSRIAPPRVLDLTAAAVRGLSAPGDTVAVYRVADLGTFNGRYWARRAEPLALGVADAAGAFTIPLALAPGDRVALTALAADGRTSELSQARRPVVFAPGIGGTWLRDTQGTDLWLPVAFGSDDKNARMRRIAMAPDGQTSAEPIVADEVLEGIGPARLIYGPMHDALEQAGFAGDPRNLDPATLDQWRFPNDWRRSASVLADDFRALVDRVTTASGQTAASAARACQTDVIAHSNGGVISSVYLRRDADHARDRVHRYLSSGVPYLGADQAVAASTVGYVFGADEGLGLLGGWDVAWGDMIGMTRNVPGAYGLMPSRRYYDAIEPASVTYRFGYSLMDLYGEPLSGYDEVLGFLGDDKTVAGVVPRGLARNRPLADAQQADVHDLIDDWRTFEGPPHIFRHVGLLVGRTAVGWFLGAGPEFLEPGATARSESGDTDRHRAYRERLRSIPGLGDQTVPLLSATLGRNALVGRLDLSGVQESPWIEEFEVYACAHGKLVEPGCRRTDGAGLTSVERLLAILDAGAVVPGAAALQPAAGRHAGVPAAEVLFVSASAPVAVTVADAAGRQTGPPSLSALGDIAYGVPDIAYAATRLGATLGLPADSAYTVTVTSADPAAVVTVVRQRAGLDAVTQILFPNQLLGASGRMALALAPGTPDTAPWTLDADGDGTPDGTLAPTAVLPGTSAAPALPLPQPSAFEVPAATNTEVRTALLRLPDTGTTGWTFSLAEDAPWLTLSATGGAAPAEVTLTLDPAGLPDGPVAAALALTLTNGAYAFSTTLPVTLRVGLAVADAPTPDPPTALALTAWPNPAREAVRVGVALPEAGEVRLTLYDMLGREVMGLASDALSAGTHEVPADLSGLPAGVYLLRLTTEAGTLTRSLALVR